MKLSCPNTWCCRSLIFLSSIVHVNLEIVPSNDLSINVDDKSYGEYNSAARVIVESSKGNKELLGSDDLQKTVVNQWLSYASQKIKNGLANSQQLQDINEYLSDKSYFAGFSLTAADILLYWNLHPSVIAINAKDATKFAHLLRWFNHIENEPMIKSSKMKLEERLFKASTSLPVFQSLENSPSVISTAVEAKVIDNNEKDKKKKDKVSGNEGSPASVPEKKEGKDEKIKEEKKEEEKKEENGAKKEKKEKVKKESVKVEAKKEEEQSPISRCDIRVGLIKSAKKHPDSEKLYVEEIDVGEEKPRQIVSGLAHFVKLEALDNKKVLVLCNLKAQTMAGVPSEGMVLCASNADHTAVELLNIPKDAKVGERITFEGLEGEPSPPNYMNKKKVYAELVAPHFCTNKDKMVHFNGVLAMTSAGSISAPSLASSFIG